MTKHTESQSSRRDFLKTSSVAVLGGALASPHTVPGAPNSDRTSRLSCWMGVGRPLEALIENYQQVFDGLQAGGVTGVVVVRLFFSSSDGKALSVRTFTPNPRIYRKLGVEPPAPPSEELPEKRRLLEATLNEAKRRGLAIYVLGPEDTRHSLPSPKVRHHRVNKGHDLVSEESLLAKAAHVQDVMEQYPMVTGGVLDGPEFGYEIEPGHRSYIFDDLPEGLRPKAKELGYDFDALVAAKDRFFERLHALKSPDLDLRSDADLQTWLKFRRDVLMNYYERLRKAIATSARPIKMGVGSRSPCFAFLTGSDLPALARLYDFILPKHYFFHRGYDGLYGTVGRYLQTLTSWNPGLADADALKVVEALFGLRMPWIRSRFDLDLGFPPEFFESVVKNETRRALAMVPDPSQVIPWIDAGREPHDGDPLPANDVYRILKASHEAGLRRFAYHNENHLTKGEWAVISHLCGKGWLDGQPGYAPPN